MNSCFRLDTEYISEIPDRVEGLTRIIQPEIRATCERSQRTLGESERLRVICRKVVHVIRGRAFSKDLEKGSIR